MQIKSLKVQKLFGQFDYTIDFNSKFTILTAPNGYGKSTILKIINAFATGNTFFINKIKFEEIILHFTDGTFFKINQDEKNRTLIYSYQGYSFPKRMSNIENEASLVAAIYPFLTRISINQWRHNQTGEIYELDQIFERFGQHPALRRQFSIAPWYEEVRNRLNVSFVSTNRLMSEESGMGIKNFNNTGLSVSLVAEAVKQVINEKLIFYFNQSHNLESTFANRLIGFMEQKQEESWDSIEEMINIIRKYEERYLKLHLIPQNSQNLNLDNKKDQNILNVLSLLLHDTKTKYEYLNDLAKQLELFTSSFNRLFEHKKVEISLEDGFLVKKLIDGSILSLNSLSSGEQHLIVLLGKLLFATSENSFVLIDEPEISLHPSWLEKIASIFEEIQNYKGFSLAIATHSPILIGDNCDNVIELSEQVENG